MTETRLRCDGCGWTLWLEGTEAVNGAPDIWLIHTSDRPSDMTIWNQGSRDANTTIKILCQPHISEDGCASTITRDIASQASQPEKPSSQPIKMQALHLDAASQLSFTDI